MSSTYPWCKIVFSETKMFPRLEDTVQEIPSQPGSYLLWLYLPQAMNLNVGKLGAFTLPAGDYAYLGSAHGSGGLRARLGRHLRGDGKPHWHIDYLRAVAQVRGFGCAIHGRGYACVAPTECNWSQKLVTIPGAQIVIPGFGSSDCQSRCAAHLIYYHNLNPDQITQLLNCEFRILRVA
jgi:histidyl-tRNA synthetase